MKKNRPANFVTADKVFAVIEKSISSIEHFSDQTGDAFHDTEERIDRLCQLKDIIIEISWRYGINKVLFKFTQKREIKGTIGLNEIILEPNNYWEKRITAREVPEDVSYVYIRF